MVKIFDEELRQLKTDFLRMGARVNEAIASSGAAFVNHDVKLANEVISNDHLINDLQLHLEKRSFELIALYQPVTTDLREVVGILKAVTDLERAGDHARNLARSTVKIKEQRRIVKIEKVIATMVTQVQNEFAETVDAYAHADQNRAEENVKKFDSKISSLYDEIASPSYSIMAVNSELVSSALVYLNVAKDLSRISDYSTNICEWSVYLATGKIVELN